MATVFIAFGSNLGNRRDNINQAFTLLEQHNISVIKKSTIIESDAIGGRPGQCKYLNGVIKATTQLSPIDLLNILKQIEKILGREETERNGPRPIDLDILLYDTIKLNTDNLTIPHPRMLERPFVINPLLEIEPSIILK